MKIRPILLLLFLLPCLVTGCANTAETRNGPTASQALDQLRIGMTEVEVGNLIGSPQDKAVKINANGRAEVWTYSYGALVQRTQGSGAAFRYGMSLGATHSADKSIYLTFQNGALAEMTGI